MKKTISFFLFTSLFAISNAQNVKPLPPLPSQRQLQWSKMEFYLFTHFGPNTFTDLEWGKGTEPEDMFNPTQLDCNQWCRIAKAAGAKGIIITAKHHDGFCLWPSKYSTHTVAQSKWKNGKGDVLKELSDACKKYNLKLGIYLSPWDRNHPKYGTDEYNEVFINMMKEVVSRYGPLFEFWWDGANGEGPNGKKQVYDWRKFEETMRKIAPNTVVFSDIGHFKGWGIIAFFQVGDTIAHRGLYVQVRFHECGPVSSSSNAYCFIQLITCGRPSLFTRLVKINGCPLRILPASRSITSRLAPT